MPASRRQGHPSLAALTAAMAPRPHMLEKQPHEGAQPCNVPGRPSSSSALASIAIQYTAIRTFTAKSFHTCRTQRAGLAAVVRGGPPRSPITSRAKTHPYPGHHHAQHSPRGPALPASTWTSSTCLSPSTVNTLIPRFTQGRAQPVSEVMLGASGDL